MSFVRFMTTPVYPLASQTFKTVSFTSSGILFTGCGILNAKLKQDCQVKGGMLGGALGFGLMGSLFYSTPLGFVGCLATAVGSNYLYS